MWISWHLARCAQKRSEQDSWHANSSGLHYNMTCLIAWMPKPQLPCINYVCLCVLLGSGWKLTRAVTNQIHYSKPEHWQKRYVNGLGFKLFLVRCMHIQYLPKNNIYLVSGNLLRFIWNKVPLLDSSRFLLFCILHITVYQQQHWNSIKKIIYLMFSQYWYWTVIIFSYTEGNQDLLLSIKEGQVLSYVTIFFLFSL